MGYLPTGRVIIAAVGRRHSSAALVRSRIPERSEGWLRTCCGPGDNAAVGNLREQRSFAHEPDIGRPGAQRGRAKRGSRAKLSPRAVAKDREQARTGRRSADKKRGVGPPTFLGGSGEDPARGPYFGWVAQSGEEQGPEAPLALPLPPGRWRGTAVQTNSRPMATATDCAVGSG